ncbi:MAG: hypothetical protein QW835_03730, partial [Candidatus Hadarchaeum sp.]
YSPYSLGEKVATAIFMYSFTAGAERGATIGEIKRSSSDPSITSSAIADAVDRLDESAFYLWKERGKYFFTAQPNLNKVLLTKMEGIKDGELRQEEKNLLSSHLKREHFSTYIWPSSSRDVPDTTELKLVIVQNHSKCREFLENCGEKPRVHRNTLIFLCPAESERGGFESSLRKKLAWQRIEEDATLKLSADQKKIVVEKLENSNNEVVEKLRSLYHLVLVPSRDGFKELSLGRPTYGVKINFDKEVYDALKNEGEIVERIAPLTLREKFLKGKSYAETINILNSFLNTPGEMRITSVDLLRESIREGVKQGLFGLGLLEDKEPEVRFFQKDCSPELVDGEVIISEKICRPRITKEEFEEILEKVGKSTTLAELEEISSSFGERLSAEQGAKLVKEIERAKRRLEGPKPDRYRTIELELEVPSGRLSDIARITSYLKSKFGQVDLKIELLAKDGEITVSEYEDKVVEALKQVGVKLRERTK